VMQAASCMHVCQRCVVRLLLMCSAALRCAAAAVCCRFNVYLCKLQMPLLRVASG
jgi:hypothetical protein